MVLRAELVQNDRLIVAHTTELTAHTAFVRTDERLDLGSSLELRLSFPRLLPAVNIAARVVSRDGGSGHGYWPGFMLQLDTENERIDHLLRSAGERETPGTYRIIVVEDSPTMRDVMQFSASHFSRSFRIDMVSCDNVAQAQERIAAETFDLAVVDLFLPGDKTGADFVRELRARGEDLPVIGFSIGGAEARRTFLDAGADLFLDKPVILRDVFTTLQRLVGAARVES